MTPKSTASTATRARFEQQRAAISARFPAANVTYHAADFTRPLDLPPLDGALMANSLHFVKAQSQPSCSLIRGYLKPGGRLIIVEYNTDRGNTWGFLYPFSAATWAKIAAANGFVETHQLWPPLSEPLSRRNLQRDQSARPHPRQTVIGGCSFIFFLSR